MKRRAFFHTKKNWKIFLLSLANENNEESLNDKLMLTKDIGFYKNEGHCRLDSGNLLT